MKILVVRFSSIGDIVLTTPVVRCLKQQLVGVQVHYLTKKSFASILQHNPYIDKIHTIDKGDISEVLPDLLAENYDCVIDLHKNLRTMRLKWALKTKNYSFDKLNIQKWLLVNLKINLLPSVHIVERYLATVAPLGVVDDGKGLDYFIPEKDHIEVPKEPYIAFVIGATYATKRLPRHKIIEICQEIKMPIMLLGGKDEAEEGRMIAEKAGNHVKNLCGLYNLNQSASWVQQAHSVVTHDTGLMHIAAAFGKPIVSVWGNTMPELGMYPYRIEENMMVEVKGLKCRPCSKIGSDKCPKGHFDCMEQIKMPSELIEKWNTMA